MEYKIMKKFKFKIGDYVKTYWKHSPDKSEIVKIMSEFDEENYVYIMIIRSDFPNYDSKKGIKIKGQFTSDPEAVFEYISKDDAMVEML